MKRMNLTKGLEIELKLCKHFDKQSRILLVGSELEQSGSRLEARMEDGWIDLECSVNYFHSLSLKLRMASPQRQRRFRMKREE